MDALIASVEQHMRQLLETAEQETSGVFRSADLPIYSVVRYHLGWADQQFEPASADGGKRIRPLICLFACQAASGDISQAVPVASAIELLHNFTLIHDDIQDGSATRRHRSTIWSLWGNAQAINAGDATFALSQLALLDATRFGVDPVRLTTIQREFNLTALRILEGQVLDLGYEDRWDIEVDDYLRMISGKTAAIIGFAAWSGATLAGVTAERGEAFRNFGLSLGLGFQVRDDMLGIWGEPDVTGKPAADDIRRRKKSLPIIALAERASEPEHRVLECIYSQSELDEADVEHVLSMLAKHNIVETMSDVVSHYHDEARNLLHQAAVHGEGRDALDSLLDRLASRDF